MTAIRSRDDRGASAVEYGILVAAVAGVIVAVLFLLGGMVVDLFSETCDEVTTKVSGSC